MKHIFWGDRGTLVSYLQLALTRAGFPLTQDGIFGDRTCAALRQFLGDERACSVTQAVWDRLIPYLRGFRSDEAGVWKSLIFRWYRAMCHTALF